MKTGRSLNWRTCKSLMMTHYSTMMNWKKTGNLMSSGMMNYYC